MDELEILDSTLGLRPGPAPGDDEMEMQRLMRGVSILNARFVLFDRVISRYRQGAAEFLIASLTAEPHLCFRYNNELAGLFPEAIADTKPDQFDGNEVITFWRKWLTGSRTEALHEVPWRIRCPRLQKAIQAYETTDDELMLDFGTEDDPVVRYALARNPNLSDTAFAILCEDAEEDIRLDLAKRADASPEVLQRLAADTSEIVRRWVAGNPKTPIGALSVLAGQADREIRLSLVRNTSLPKFLLEQLAACGDSRVETEAQKAISLPIWTIEMWEAIDARKVDKVRALLKLNEDLGCLVDQAGATPLHRLATAPITETAYLCAKALFAERLSVNARDALGRTPMHIAVAATQPIAVKFVKQLIEAGGDLKLATSDGRTAFQLASEHEYRPMIDFLRQCAIGRGIDIG